MEQPGLERGGLLVNSFLAMLANRLCGSLTVGQPEEVMRGTLWYLGGGYWRVVQDHETGRFHLINPDYSHDEICVVEQAMQLLITPWTRRKEPRA
jgi:hypothetical protein